MLIEINQTQEDKYYMISLSYVESKIVKLIKTENKMVAYIGLREGQMGDDDQSLQNFSCAR